MVQADDTRFAFGKNWQAFLSTITEESIAKAETGLRKLFPNGEIGDATFLDIGCGSGLSMLAASRQGAKQLCGFDLDVQSVEAAKNLLAGRNARVFHGGILDVTPQQLGHFDIVYSWGVLHHTGWMWESLERACAFVRPGGLLAVALYRKTPLCAFWTREKKLYAEASTSGQRLIRTAYKTLFLAGLLADGKNPARYVRDYRSARGMSWHHDVHDWLGGYPYESVEPEAVKSRLSDLGFEIVRSFEKPARARGVFGSHCDEFVARRHRLDA
jgi:2-polyprenyl-6-hydroxyphenyl methylase/3-demethylubiquinone-9 3-methyltransferase